MALPCLDQGPCFHGSTLVALARSALEASQLEHENMQSLSKFLSASWCSFLLKYLSVSSCPSPRLPKRTMKFAEPLLLSPSCLEIPSGHLHLEVANCLQPLDLDDFLAFALLERVRKVAYGRHQWPGTVILKLRAVFISQAMASISISLIAFELVHLEVVLVVPRLDEVCVVCDGLPKLEGTSHLGLGVYGKSSLP